jgi:hypothetical protein
MQRRPQDPRLHMPLRECGLLGCWGRSERRVLEPVGEQFLLAEDFDGGVGGR